MADRRGIAFGKAYKNRQEPEKQAFEPLPDGDYKVIMGKPTIGYSKNKENPRYQVTWPMTVADGELVGKLAYKFNGLDATENKTQEQQLGYLTADMQRLGLTPPEWCDEFEKAPEMLLDAIMTECEKVEGMEVEITAKKKGEFTNIYYNEAATPGTKPATPARKLAPKPSARPVQAAPKAPVKAAPSKGASMFRR